MTCVFTYKGKEYVGEAAFKAALKAAPFEEIKGFLRPDAEAARAALRENQQKFMAARQALEAALPQTDPERFAEYRSDIVAIANAHPPLLWLENKQNDRGLDDFSDETRKALADIQAIRLRGNEISQEIANAVGGGIPNAPFKNNGWAALVLKRMVRWAAENGFDSVAWIPGNIQNGNELGDTGDNRGAFYDKILVNEANKLGKKYGARVGVTAPLTNVQKLKNWPQAGRITEEDGQFSATAGDGSETRGPFRYRAQAIQALDDMREERKKEGVAFHTLPITPELKAAALEGQPLFQENDRGQFVPGAPRGERSVITLFADTNLSTLLHEASHWYLDNLWQMAQVENPHPSTIAELAAIKEWAGKHPEWNAMFEPTGAPGQFTKEGRELHEKFAEHFEVYMREGKAPSAALRPVFASIKQWLLSIYKEIKGRFFEKARSGGRDVLVPALNRVQLNDKGELDPEVRAIFDRMLATDEAIAAVHGVMARNTKDLAQVYLDKGVITPKQFERTKARIAQARERAEAELTARLMEDYERQQTAKWREERRQVQALIEKEVDARPEQRAFNWLAGKGWRTGTQPTKQVDPAQALRQRDELMAFARYFEPDATDENIMALRKRMIEDSVVPVILLFKTTSGRVMAFLGPNGADGWHHDLAREMLGLGDLKLQHGVWNPWKWPTIEAMNAAGDHAWYATSGFEDEKARGLGQFMPMTASGAPTDTLWEALKMAGTGQSRELIWQNTGWAQTLDGEWVYEIKGEPAWRIPVLAGQKAQTAFLEDWIEWPELFAAMPSLGKWKVSLSIGKPAGETYPVLNLIRASGAVSSSDTLMEVLRHEIQHAIQFIGGHKSIGANPSVEIYRGTKAFENEVAFIRTLEAEANRLSAAADPDHIIFDANDVISSQEDIEKAAAFRLYLRNKGEMQARDVEMRSRWHRSTRERLPPYTGQNGERQPDLDRTWATIDELRSDSVSGDQRLPEGRGAAAASGAGAPDRVRTPDAGDRGDGLPAKSTGDAQAASGGERDNGTRLPRPLTDEERKAALGVLSAREAEFWRRVRSGEPEARILKVMRLSRQQAESLRSKVRQKGFDIPGLVMTDGERIIEAAAVGRTSEQIAATLFPGKDQKAAAARVRVEIKRGAARIAELKQNMDWQQRMGLSQSQGSPPTLDALGFYSAAQESALRIPDNIWKMGWQAAQNALFKGRGGIAPNRRELDYLGLSRGFNVFADTPLKGDELKQAVLEHIAAHKLNLIERFNRFDPKNPGSRQLPSSRAWKFRVISDAGIIPDHWDEQRRANFTPLKAGEVFHVYDMARADEMAAGIDVREGVKLEALGEEQLFYDVPLDAEDAGVRRGPGDIRLNDKAPVFEWRALIPPGVVGSDAETHWSREPSNDLGVLVSSRGEEREDADGGRTLFNAEIQSDLAQQAHAARKKRLANEPVIFEKDGVWYVLEDHSWYNPNFGGQWRMFTVEAQAKEYAAKLEEDRNAQKRVQAFGAPLIDETSQWTNVAVRAMVYRAARDGFDSVSFATAATSKRIQGNPDAANHYETNVKGALEKIAKQLGGEVERGAVWVGSQKKYTVYDPASDKDWVFKRRRDADAFVKTNPGLELRRGDKASAYIMAITPEMRAKIVTEGFPLFQPGADDGGRGMQPVALPPMRLDLKAVEAQYGKDAVAKLPPEVRAFSANATDADQFAQQAVDTKRTLAKRPPRSLWKFLSRARVIGDGDGKLSYQGIRDEGGEIIAIIGEKRAAPGLIANEKNKAKRVRSYSIHEAAVAAWEEGYFNGESPPDDDVFLDALRADFDGTAVLYSSKDAEAVNERESAQRWEQWFEDNEIDIDASPTEIKMKLETVLSGETEGAIGPDQAAPFFGMADGRELLKGISEGPRRNEIIRKLTDQTMTERHGDPFKDGTISKLAEEYARNEVQARQLEIELEALAQTTGKVAAGNLAKVTAREALRGKQVREVLNYNQWLTLEQRWGRKALEAAEKGKFDEAADYKRNQLVNLHMFREGRKLAEEIESGVKFVKSFEKKDKRIKLAKAGEDYLDQMDQILDNYEFRKRTLKALGERKSLAAWFADKTAAADPLRNTTGMTPEEVMAQQQEEIDRSAALASLQAESRVINYQSLTAEEFMAVRDQADMIARLARQSGTLLEENERRLLQLAIDDIVAGIEAAQPNKRPAESLASFSPKEARKRGWGEYMAELRTLQSLVRQVDGKDNGPMARQVLYKLNGAFARRLARMRTEEAAVVKLYRDAYGTNLSELRKDPMRFAGVEVPLAKMERLTVALNMGTEINRKRLMDGYGWSAATLQEIVNTLDENDWTFVKSVWAYVNSLYPEANDAHLAVHGVPLSKQPGIPVVTRFGVIDGAYWPIKYNPHQSSRAAQQALQEEAKQIAGRVGTRKTSGFTKERVRGKVTMPVLLDLSIVLPQHVDEVVASITTQKALLDVGRIIASKDIENVIVERHGRIVYKQMLNALRDARNGPENAKTMTERILIRLRHGATMVGLGLNMGTVVKQLIGTTSSLVRLGDKHTGAIGALPWLLKGFYRMGMGAQGMQNGFAFIADRSDYMRTRMLTQSREIADQQRRINDGRVKGALQGFTEKASMFLIQRVQYLGVDAPLWLGAYEKGIAQGLDEETASAGADQMVIDAQGSGEIYQIAQIQRGSPLLKLMTNFMTASIATWNLGVNRTRSTNFKNPAQAAVWALDMAVLMSIPVVLTMVVEALLSPGGGDDDDQPAEEKFIRKQLSFLMSSLGLFGQLGSAFEGFSYKGPQGTRAFAEASKAIEAAGQDIERLVAGQPMTGDAVRPLNLVAGMWFGYPAVALDRFVRGADALIKGETSDPRALISGPPRK